MTERIPTQPEQSMLPKYERLEALPDADHAEPLRKGEIDPQTLKEALEIVQQNASINNPLEELKASEEAQKAPQQTYINRELKSITLRRELTYIQRKLPPAERILSKIVHQTAIRAVSESASKSVTRPSGLLGGGLVAFFGTAGYYYLSKHIGFTYNYFIFVLLFCIGFVVGLVLEITIWLLARRIKVND